MKDKKEFHSILKAIDGRKYEDYVQLVGDFDFSRYVLKINNAGPEGGSTLFIIRVPQIIAAFPPHLFNSPVRRTALEDLLTRKIDEGISHLPQYMADGVARRRISVAAPGQKILPRTSMVITEEYVEARVYVDLPLNRSRIDCEACYDIFFEDLPSVVNSSLIYCNLDEDRAERFVDVMEDSGQIRQMLNTRGLIAFAGDGAQINRQANSDLPNNETPRLQVPHDLAVEIEVPNSGHIKGIGISGGLTLVIGDAFSGRREFVRAIADGIYNHVPGDGREYVLTVQDAVYVSAEANRAVQRVDISGFVSNSHNGTSPERYTTTHADACSAQAAATMEALEVGARVLLMDESDSSPDFIANDSRLKDLADSKDIATLAQRARQLVDELGVSIIIGAMNSAPEFIPIADMILHIDRYQIADITAEAKAIGIPASLTTPDERLTALTEKSRWIVPTSIDASLGTEDDYIQAESMHKLNFGRSTVDLSGINQLADIHQVQTIGHIMYYAKVRYMDEGRPMREILDLVDRDLSSEGLECLTRELNGSLARPRRYEIAAALNRLSSLRISHTGE